MDNRMTQIVEETGEKEKRKLNVIIDNLPGSVEDTPEEKKRDDRDRVRVLVGKLNMQCSGGGHRSPTEAGTSSDRTKCKTTSSENDGQNGGGETADREECVQLKDLLTPFWLFPAMPAL